MLEFQGGMGVCVVCCSIKVDYDVVVGSSVLHGPLYKSVFKGKGHCSHIKWGGCIEIQGGGYISIQPPCVYPGN